MIFILLNRFSTKYLKNLLVIINIRQGTKKSRAEEVGLEPNTVSRTN